MQEKEFRNYIFQYLLYASKKSKNTVLNLPVITVSYNLITSCIITKLIVPSIKCLQRKSITEEMQINASLPVQTKTIRYCHV